jgi:molecular chaperone GrpE (heat shock protein)
MNIEKEINDSKKKPEDLVDSSSTKLKENKKKAKISEPKLEKDEEITQLKESVANLKKEIEILKKKNLRLLADSDNQKKE